MFWGMSEEAAVDAASSDARLSSTDQFGSAGSRYRARARASLVWS
jgi:hypothetical protein